MSLKYCILQSPCEARHSSNNYHVLKAYQNNYIKLTLQMIKCFTTIALRAQHM